MKSDDFRCKNCGGMMRFDPKSGNLKCENCGTEEELLKNFTNKRHGINNYENRIKNQISEGKTIVECSSCGATIEMDAFETSQTCPYCDSNIVLSEKAVSVLEPDGMKPFLVDRKEVGQLFSEWIKKRWFAPNVLKTLYQSGKVTGIYLPYWSFDTDADSEYTAEGGIDRTETYEEDGKIKTRIVTDWYFVRGNVQNEFENVIMRASRTLKDSLIRNLGGFNVEDTIDFASGYLSGYNSEIFKVPMRQGYEESKQIMENRIYNTISSDVLRRYDRVRNIRFDVYWSNEYYRLLLLPVYTMSYSFNGKSYQVLINGESGIMVGEYPKSAVKIAFAVIVAIIIAAAIIYYLYK